MWPEPGGGQYANMLMPQQSRQQLLSNMLMQSGLGMLADNYAGRNKRGAAPYIRQGFEGYQSGLQNMQRNQMARQQLGMQQQGLDMRQTQAEQRSTLFDREIAAQDAEAERLAGLRAQYGPYPEMAYQAELDEAKAERVRTLKLEDRGELRDYEADVLAEDRGYEEGRDRVAYEDKERLVRLTASLKKEPGGEFKNTKKLRDEHGYYVKKHEALDTAYRSVKAAEDSAVGDLSMIVSFMKMIDPGSVVREGEVDTVKRTTGVPGYVANLYDAVLKGSKLNPEQRQQIQSQAEALYSESTSKMTGYDEAFSRLAESYGIDPSRVVMRFTSPATLFDTPATGAAAGAKPMPPNLPPEVSDLWEHMPDIDRDLWFSE